jgi:hypothetical protein
MKSGSDRGKGFPDSLPSNLTGVNRIFLGARSRIKRDRESHSSQILYSGAGLSLHRQSGGHPVFKAPADIGDIPEPALPHDLQGLLSPGAFSAINNIAGGFIPAGNQFLKIGAVIIEIFCPPEVTSAEFICGPDIQNYTPFPRRSLNEQETLPGRELPAPFTWFHGEPVCYGR